ncbi:hypothetical protein NOV72_03377 [Caballeronia novacaledonica]|uniref:Uncharacterized protein n=1 Tax=Caballeronia novacaledonica TaxID=1544861 RepID=A0A2U3I7L3_9BURK|nr:hypothetical protein [Caballeronia novacaledonica]SPB16177.1 hypothetical protein NOV72_03377 [Caballeronia novacaledonica]
MKNVNNCANPGLVRGGITLTGVKGGFLTRIIDSNDLENVNFVLKTAEGALYCGQLNIATHENRNNLLMMALDYGLPITLSGDDSGNITGLAVAPSDSAIPSLSCSFLKLQDSRTGMVMRIVDKDPGSAVTYVLQANDGSRYCAQMWPSRDNYDNRNHLFMMALRMNIQVTIAGGANHEVTSIAVGS